MTVFLVNGQAIPEKSRDEAWLFQPEISVRAADGEAIFVPRDVGEPISGDELDTEERMLLEMQYRDQVEFAVGHGTSVHAESIRSRSAASDRALHPRCAVVRRARNRDADGR